MTTKDIRKKLHDYIDSASDKKVKAFYTIIEEEVTDDYDLLEDPSFLAEMDRRYENYKANPDAAKTWDEVKKSARKKNAARKK